MKKRIEELIGKTPMLEPECFSRDGEIKAHIILKLESFNPTGSAKDRAALEMINDAETRGILKPNGTIIEATSGNTGIGLAAIGASRGYKVIIIMPDSMSPERIKFMKAYGAEVVLSDGSKGMSGTAEKVEEVKKQYPDAFEAGQFINPANAMAHYKTTGPEIWNDMEGEVDIFVAGVGTGGTITGTGRYLKEKKKDIKIVAVEPKSSPLLTEGRSGSHGIQGIGADFIPQVLDQSVLDEIIDVNDEDAYQAAGMLGKKAGIMCGISGGAVLHAAIELSKDEANAGKNIVVLLPDSGDRYLSSDLFK